MTTATLPKALTIAIVTAVAMLVSGADRGRGATLPGPQRHPRHGGGSLIGLVAAAVDGDRLRVQGTCPGEIVIREGIVITGVGDRPTLTGRDRTRVVSVERGATVTLRQLRIRRGEGEYKAGGILNEGRLTLWQRPRRAATRRGPRLAPPRASAAASSTRGRCG